MNSNAPDVLVATPGRLLDHLGQRALDQVQHLVLDSRPMRDMGMPDVKRIVEKCPRQRQSMLFSATIPP
jgi:ATP-dependent RNA helicase RhlE